MKWLVSQAKEQLVRLQPYCGGIFFEVDMIDLALIEQSRMSGPNQSAVSSHAACRGK